MTREEVTMKYSCCFALSALILILTWLLPLQAADTGQANLAVVADHVDFLAGNDLVGRYHFIPASSSLAKPYFWPLNGPSGVPITRAWPMEKQQPGGSDDHPHQKSAWFCHGDVIPEDVPLQSRIKGVEGVDFWSEGKGHG